MDVLTKTNLKPAATSFHGRAQDLARLDALFGEEGPTRVGARRLVTIVGPAGTGKTRLAQRWAELHVDAFSRGDGGGVWFCDLTEARDRLGVCAAIARALDVALVPSEPDVVARIGRSLASRGRVLLVVDNCEQVAADVGTVLASLLEATAGAQFLATSREVLRIGGEQVYELLPLSLPVQGEEANAESVQLFVDRARLVASGYSLEKDDAAVVGAIVRELDGLPLAIELAAACMAMLDAKTILERLPRRFALLTGGARELSARQRTLESAIEWSWQLLQPWERAALAQCSVFRGGFTLDAAEAVLRLPPGSPATFDVLRALHDKSLVRSVTVADASHAREQRFVLYESIREHARGKLAAFGDDAVDATRSRHAEHFVRVGAEWAEHVNERGGAEARRRLGLETDNLIAAHDHALPRAPRDALRAMLALDAIFSRRGPFATHLALLDATLADTPSKKDPALRAMVHVARAKARRAHGRWSDARDDLDAALDAAKRAHDPYAEGRALTTLGLLESLEGKLDEARTRHERALAAFKKAKNRRWQGMSSGNLGALHQRAGRLEEARACYEQTLSVARELGDEASESTCSSNLALILQEEGRLEDARALVERALVIDLRLGDRQLEATDRMYLAGVLHEAGDLDAAERAYIEAIAMLREGGHRPLEAMTSSGLAALRASRGEVEAAARAMDDAEATLDAIGAKPLLVVARTHRAHLELARARACRASGDTAGARRHRASAERQARASAESAHLTDEIRFAQRLLARALRQDGDAYASASDDGAIVIAANAKWFSAPHRDRIDLSRRPRVRALLLALVDARETRPGEPVSTERLLQRAWPGERVMRRAGANRVYVTLATLRELGLRGVLRSAADGYLLDPMVRIVRREGST